MPNNTTTASVIMMPLIEPHITEADAARLLHNFNQLFPSLALVIAQQQQRSQRLTDRAGSIPARLPRAGAKGGGFDSH